MFKLQTISKIVANDQNEFKKLTNIVGQKKVHHAPQLFNLKQLKLKQLIHTYEK